MSIRLAAAVAGCLVLAAAPAFALDAKVEDALKTFTAIGNDAGRLKTYCEMTASMASSETDTDKSKSQDVDAKIESLMKALGPDFGAAMDLEDKLASDSPELKAYSDAVDALDAKCPK